MPHVSRKKGSNLLCRVANPSPQKVCEYVKRLPKYAMPESRFRYLMGGAWFNNEHQAPEQWGLYYIDGKNYYPRFNRDISELEAERYLYGWMKRFIVINPYTRFKQVNDNNLVKSIVEYMEKNPVEHNLKTILSHIIRNDEPFVLNEILANALSQYSEVLNVEAINKDKEFFNVQLVENYKEILNTKYMTKKEYFDLFSDIKITSNINEPKQVIYYGAPGTGKSNEIKILTGRGKDGFVFSKNFTFRITFHPDSDYSSFVGAYKPIWNKVQEKIVYDFRPQTFLKAYVAAWTHPSDNVALVIEEINRGNCAQIFGDIFQLLDREECGLSKYPIESDIDMKDFLSLAFSGKIEETWAGFINEEGKNEINAYYSNHYESAFDMIKSGEILALPKNLSVLATMNTSDQSLFPMDSAFKRRWDWVYMPIKNEEKKWKIKLDDSHELIDWWKFLERINNVVADLTTSEDKQLGYFFCQPDEFIEANKDNRAPDAKPDLISAKRFVDKVIFYLWNDVFKDYAFDINCCKDDNDKEVLFAKFYNEDGKTINIKALTNFFKKLKNDEEESLVIEITPNPENEVSNEMSDEMKVFDNVELMSNSTPEDE